MVGGEGESTGLDSSEAIESSLESREQQVELLREIQQKMQESSGEIFDGLPFEHQKLDSKGEQRQESALAKAKEIFDLFEQLDVSALRRNKDVPDNVEFLSGNKEGLTVNFETTATEIPHEGEKVFRVFECIRDTEKHGTDGKPSMLLRSYFRESDGVVGYRAPIWPKEGKITSRGKNVMSVSKEALEALGYRL